MTMELQPRQRLLLWRLIACGGEDWQKNLRPKPDPTLRRPLEKARLIRVEKKKPGNYLKVTERGWTWASKNLSGPFSRQPDASGEVLGLMLNRLNEWTANQGTTLAEFFASDTRSSQTEKAIENTYYELSRGRKNVRIRLSELRPKLEDTRSKVDAALQSMMNHQKATLYRLDKPQDIKAADRKAAFVTPAGAELHLIYLGGQPS